MGHKTLGVILAEASLTLHASYYPWAGTQLGCSINSTFWMHFSDHLSQQSNLLSFSCSISEEMAMLVKHTVKQKVSRTGMDNMAWLRIQCSCQSFFCALKNAVMKFPFSTLVASN